MQYNFHIEKYQASAVGGIRREQFREYSDPRKYKNYVDPERTKYNIYRGLKDDGTGRDWQKEIRNAKARTRETTGRAVRKDAVLICSAVESLPKSWPRELAQFYFEDKATWFRTYLSERAGLDHNSLLSMAVHFDESTPHCTYVFLPMKDGRLQAKNILTKPFLRNLQQDGQEFARKWISENCQGFEKIQDYIPDSGRHHLNEVEYKEAQITKREQELAEIVQAPDFKTYSKAIEENRLMREEITVKDRIINSLTSERDRLLEYAAKLKLQLSAISEKAGSKLMNLLGFQQTENGSLNPYPSKSVTAGIRDMLSGFQQNRQYRVLPDLENEGKFRVAYRDYSGSYATEKGGFDTRELAETYRKNLVGVSRELSEQYNERQFRK